MSEGMGIWFIHWPNIINYIYIHRRSFFLESLPRVPDVWFFAPQGKCQRSRSFVLFANQLCCLVGGVFKPKISWWLVILDPGSANSFQSNIVCLMVVFPKESSGSPGQKSVSPPIHPWPLVQDYMPIIWFKCQFIYRFHAGLWYRPLTLPILISYGGATSWDFCEAKPDTGGTCVLVGTSRGAQPQVHLQWGLSDVEGGLSL